MWKDIVARKGVKSLKVRYEVKGLNQDRLIARLRKKGLALYDVKKISNRKMYISVNFNESKNFFAITKELCYNVRKVRLTGKGKPIFQLMKNFGLVIGAVIFLFCTVIADDFVFNLSFTGNGSIYKREVIEYLSMQGVTRFSRFSSINLERLEDEILSSNSHLTFVSAEKKGKTLSIYLVLKSDGVERLEGNLSELKSNVNGRIESIKVYRGTAVKSVGDTVGVGDVIVDGFAQIKEQTVKVNVLAYVVIVCSHQTVYRSELEKQESVAIMLAEEELSGREIIGSSVSILEKLEGENKIYEYTVNTEYKHIIYAG